MPRDLPLGNGRLQVNFDRTYRLIDLFWPYVGQENHTGGRPLAFGVWVDGQFRWVDDAGWERRLQYAGDALVTAVGLRHPDLRLSLACQDAVDFHEDVFLRELTVCNEADEAREVRLYFGQDLHIGGTGLGDSAYYEPQRRAVFHYKRKRWFLANAAKEIDGKLAVGVDEWAVGEKETPGREGTWKDAEDGRLSGNAVAQGSVDSTIALHLTVPAGGEARAWYWIAVAEDFERVVAHNRSVREHTPAEMLRRTRNYWMLWVNKDPSDLSDLPEPLAQEYRRSLLVLRTQIDNEGGIVASTDYEMARYRSDSYGYVWPRDGALVAATLIDAGYPQITRRFFDFCHQAMTREGYLLHKFNPDGSLGSSWHGWHNEGKKELPIQEDETALVLWALWRHFQRFRDIEFVKPHYRGVIIRSGNWMTDYRDPRTGLPLPSWDLWEERRGIHAWTAAATWAGLQACGSFAEAFGETDLADKYRSAAGGVKSGVEKHFWDEERGRFLRMLRPKGGGRWERDATVDASLFGLWYFGMFPVDDPRMLATMRAVRERLWVKSDVGGVARYEDDYYHQVSRDVANVPGNPWVICTLWLAQWYIARATSLPELDRAVDLLRWVERSALPSGVLAEQLHPYTREPLSVSPLTWSHATLVQTIGEYLRKRRALAMPVC
ncbi:MAG: glycoside hydrolase family 15 protein [Armatimonadetes bacterium]|nr:glycoside hydrolase family 15 protein [Armatimonadota bacterium]